MTTHFGIGLSPDSVVYISAARSFLAGRGFESDGEPLTRFPPAYPALIAIASLIDGEALHAARWLHAILFAANVVLVGIAVYLSTDRNTIAVFFAVLLFISCESMLNVHNMAWSESLFITFSLLAFILLVVYMSSHRLIALILSFLFLAFALMTRYAGITLLPPMLFVLAMFNSSTARRRLRDFFVLLIVGIFPFAMWLVRGYTIAGSVGGRRLAFHPIPVMRLKRLINSIYLYWFPIGAPFWVKAIVVLLACMLLGYTFFITCRAFFKNTGQVSSKTIVLQSLILSFVFIYVAFTLISMMFLEASMTFDYRILSPVHAMSIIFVVTLCWSMINIVKTRAVRWAYVAILPAIILLNMRSTIIEVDVLRADGRGYSSRKWRHSEIVAYAKTLPEGINIYSNGWDVICFFAGKKAKMMPGKVSPSTLQPNPNFEKKMNAVLKDVFENDALVIYFKRKSTRWFMPTKDELDNVYNLPVLYELDDGTVYGAGNADMIRK